LAFSSATHDIAADGFYMHALSSHDQSWMIGIRNSFYRFAILFGQGLLVMFAGIMEFWTGNVTTAWSVTFGVLAGLFIIVSIYHRWTLPMVCYLWGFSRFIHHRFNLSSMDASSSFV